MNLFKSVRPNIVQSIRAFRVPELAQANRGTQVLLEIASTDEISLDVSCRVLEIFAGEGEVPEEELEGDSDEGDDDLAEVSAEAAADAAAEDASETAAEGGASPEAGQDGDDASAPRDTGTNPPA